MQKLREERERLTEEVKQLRDHNYSLMSDITSLGQEKSAALLANRDLQIEVTRPYSTPPSPGHNCGSADLCGCVCVCFPVSACRWSV